MAVDKALLAIFMVTTVSYITYAAPQVQPGGDALSPVNPPPLEDRSLNKITRDGANMSGAISLKNYRPNGNSTVDVYYTLAATVGAQRVHLVVDTVTTDLVINPGVYNKSLAARPWPDGTVFYETYSNGWNVSGNSAFWDKVVLYHSFDDAPINDENATISTIANNTFGTLNQTIGIADVQPYQPLHNIPPPQGAVGLGLHGASLFHTMSTNGTPNYTNPLSLFETLDPSLSAPVVGLALTRWSPPGMDIGKADYDNRVDKDICWVAALPQVFSWEADLQSIKVGTKEPPIYGAEGSTYMGVAILDSKYPAIQLPQSIANAYYELVPGSVQNVYPCETALPTLTLRFKDTQCEVSIPGEALKRFELGNGKCMMAVESSGVNSFMHTLGIPFFNTMYTVLDYGSRRIGIGQHAGLQDMLSKLRA